VTQSVAHAKSEGWDYREVPLTHAAPAVALDGSADLLVEIAARKASRTAS
jgi:hypothetical protein